MLGHDELKRALSAVTALLVVAVWIPTSPGDAASDRQRRRTPVVEACERIRDSVVNISTTEIVEQRVRGDFFGFGDVYSVPRERTSVGSGFVIHEDGYIGTNAHVVSRGAQLTVTFADGSEYEARIIGRDRKRDIAVIKIEPDKPLRPIVLGRSDDLMIGEQTIAVGNPVGLHNSVTTGVISAVGRELTIGGQVVYRDVIQTDASINPGNSGGPLLNVLGELIGINTAIRGDAQNIGFAIPVDQLREMLPEILDSEKRNNVQVGMRVSGTAPPRVEYVRKGSPADQAGVRSGDVVEAVGDRVVAQPVDFYVELLGHRAGEIVPLKLRRGGEVRVARMNLTPMPKPDGAQMVMRLFGMAISDVKGSTARVFRRRKQGVLVQRIERGSPADRQGILPGDLLVSLGRYYIDDIDHVGQLLEGAKSGDAVDIGLLRYSRGVLYEANVRLYAR